ncbi:MAG TPA: SGNH/GDSL hydrolase family protein [Solirubrobacteraceae bacterium]|nr:SGNH/GDSL hydrolase family protein [Solirubrobacteraceae bacterium]
MRRRFGVLATLAMTVGVLLTAAQAAAAQPSYVALGDSYAAGDGTGVYYNTSCYQSPDSYPPLVAAADGYALNFQACSGATTSTVESSQLSALGTGTKLVTVQVGGNDAGFTNVMVSCAVEYFTCTSAISSANAEIENDLPGLLSTLYGDIHKDAPNARVLVIGYPRLFDAAGDTCGINLLTSSHEKDLNNTANLLDSAIQDEAADHGFTFVDPRSAFSSHELCSSSPWLNNDTIPVQESYHPNIAGEAGYASLIEGIL